MVLAASEVDLKLHELARLNSSDGTVVRAAKPSELIKTLYAQKILGKELRERCFRAFGRRNLLAHGVWVNRFGAEAAFLKIDVHAERDGEVTTMELTETDLLAWIKETEELSDAFDHLIGASSRSR